MFFSVYSYSNPKSPFLGIGFSEFKKDNFTGIKIDYIVPSSSADRSTLQSGDIIYMIDYQNLVTKNISENFRRYIQNEKEIGEEIVLHYLRNTLTISKDIEGAFVNVLYDVDHVVSDVNQLVANGSLSYKFDKQIDQKIEKFILGAKPLTAISTPNISLRLFPSISYIAPYYSELINVLKVYDGFQDVFDRLEEKQFYNEFWDDGFRFPLVRYLHVNYDKLPSFTRLLQQELGSLSVYESFVLQQRLSDEISVSERQSYPKSKVFDDHYNFILGILEKAHMLLTRSFQNISEDERDFMLSHTLVILNELSQNFIITDQKSISNHDIVRYFSILKNVEIADLVNGYSYLLQLWDHDWLNRLSKSMESEVLTQSKIDGITGDLYFAKETDFGLFVIAGKGANTYTADIAFLIDLGGHDIYRNNAAGYFLDSYVNVLIDLDGNDIYSSTSPYSQGSSLLGYGLLIDTQGDDLYRGHRLSQGAGVIGCGAIIDYEGDDSFMSQDFSQGFSLFGYGFIYDYRGSDAYTASLFSQAVGFTYGVGSIFDFYGDDTYFLGNRDFSSYGSVGIFKGAGQGLGFGIRHLASGGIGFLYDHKGDDQYEAGNFSQGTGYFYGLGILVDDAGDDSYLGARYSIASSAHNALGILRDRKGDDMYKVLYGSSMGVAWDNSNAFFIDEAGDDIYDCLDRNFCLSQADHNSFSLFNDRDGKDVYMVDFNRQAPSNSYNDGYSFSIHIDEGGDTDFYAGLSNVNNESKEPKNSFLLLDLKSSLSKYLRQL